MQPKSNMSTFVFLGLSTRSVVGSDGLHGPVCVLFCGYHRPIPGQCRHSAGFFLLAIVYLCSLCSGHGSDPLDPRRVLAQERGIPFWVRGVHVCINTSPRPMDICDIHGTKRFIFACFWLDPSPSPDPSPDPSPSPIINRGGTKKRIASKKQALIGPLRSFEFARFQTIAKSRSKSRIARRQSENRCHFFGGEAPRKIRERATAAQTLDLGSPPDSRFGTSGAFRGSSGGLLRGSPDRSPRGQAGESGAVRG